MSVKSYLLWSWSMVNGHTTVDISKMCSEGSFGVPKFIPMTKTL